MVTKNEIVNQLNNLREEFEVYKAEFEKMRPKFKSLIDQLNENLINDNSNDSGISEIEESKEVGI